MKLVKKKFRIIMLWKELGMLIVKLWDS